MKMRRRCRRQKLQHQIRFVFETLYKTMNERTISDQQPVDEFKLLTDAEVLALDEYGFRNYMGDRLNHILTSSPVLRDELANRYAHARNMDDPFDFVRPSGMEIELYRNPYADNPNECEFFIRQRPKIDFVVNTLVIHPEHLYVQHEVRASETDRVPVRDDWYESSAGHVHGYVLGGLKSAEKMKLLAIRVLDDTQNILGVADMT